MNRAFRLKFIFILLIVMFVSAETVDAQLDPTFGTNGITITGFSENPFPLASFLLPDGKFLIIARTNQSATRYHFIRYNSDGTLDSTYGSGGKIEVLPISGNNGVNLRAFARQPDGKILVAGGGQNGFVARFNENGTLDASFAVGGIHRPNINQTGNDWVTAIVVQPDGRILVGGNAQYTSSPSRMFLLRYNANGTLDESFGSEGFTVYPEYFVSSDTPRSLFVQSNGKIIVDLPLDPSTPSTGSVRRFTANGAIDNAFTTVFFHTDEFVQIAVQPDDKIVVAGYLTKNDPLDRTHSDIVINRYTPDGAPDASFGAGGQATADATGSYFDEYPLGIEILPGGEILIHARVWVQPNRNRALKGSTLTLVKLSPTGAVNGRLLVTPGTGVSGLPILVQPDGKIVLFDFYVNPAPGNFRPDLLLARVTGVPSQTYRFKGVPFDFKFPNFDGLADPSVFRPGNRNWYLYNVFPGYFFGLADDILVPSDYIQDLASDLAVFRPSNGTWYIARNYQNPASNYFTIQWGQNGDVPAPADYDGDGKADLAVFRPSNGTWYIRNSSDSSARIVQWGLNGDKPTPGDFDGDGLSDIAVFRPSDGNWYILRSSDNQSTAIHFGLSGDIPVQEDYDGDGKFDIAVQRPSDGVWYRLNSSDGSFFALQWGIPADIAVPADFDGDGKTDIAVWRQTNGRWYVYQSSNSSMAVYNWGVSTDVPLQRRF